MKKHWIQYAGQWWKDFKTKLTSKYIFGNLSHMNPCDKYSFLDPVVWNEFVQLHTGPEYEVSLFYYQLLTQFDKFVNYIMYCYLMFCLYVGKKKKASRNTS